MKMLLLVMFVLFLSEGTYVDAIDLNSMFGRAVCFNEHQENCNQDFIDVYPNLSKSVTNLTVASTSMLLYTRYNIDEPEKLHKCAGRLPPNSKFDPNGPLWVIFSPYISGFCDVAVYREWKTQILLREKANVLVIDYSWGNLVDYSTAIMNAQKIVKYQSLIVLNNIQEETGITKDQITFIGHSLGAHLAAMVAHLFPVKRLIGLDPAGPGFSKDKTSLEDRLDPSDADFVEVWHCNAGDCLPALGINYDAGHVNFYINGGKIQPSCYPVAFQSLLKADYLYGFGTLLLPTTCFHAQCAQFFKASINPDGCQFIGVKCSSYAAFKAGKCRCGLNGRNCLIMGFDTINNITEIPRTPQKYYVETSFYCPYCDNKYVKSTRFSSRRCTSKHS